MTHSAGLISIFKSLPWSRLTLLAILLFSTYYTVKKKWHEDDWKNVQGSDGTGYYAYLPATYIYQDYSFHFIDSLAPSYPKLGIAKNCGFCNLFDGKGVNKYFVGESILITPFFLIAHLASGSKEHPADGYSYFYMLAISLAAIFYLLLGLWSTRKLLQRFQIKDGIIAIVLLCIFFGSNLFYYSIWAPEMTHVYSFGLISLFFMLLHQQMEIFQSRRFIFMSCIFGLIILVRPVNALSFLAIPFFAGSLPNLRLFFLEIFRRPKILGLALVIFFLTLSIQSLYYYLQSGQWWVYAYAKEGFDFMHPNFFNCLFSYSNGLFVYCPILFVALFGILTLLPTNKFRFVSFFILFIPTVWVISSWWAWTYGAAFGMRPLVEYFSVFALSLGFLLNKIEARKFLLIGICILLLLPLIILCQLQMWQYNNGIIGWDRMKKENYWLVFLETRDQFKFINRDTVPGPLPENGQLIYSKKINFENSDSSYDTRSVMTGKSFSGQHAVCLKEGNNHPPYFKIRLGDYFPDSICRSGKLWVNAKSKWLLEDNGSEARWNVVIRSNGRHKFFKSEYVNHQVRTENKWDDCILNVHLPPMESNDSLFVFPERNIWFPVYVDDMEVNVYLAQ